MRISSFCFRFTIYFQFFSCIIDFLPVSFFIFFQCFFWFRSFAILLFSTSCSSYSLISHHRYFCAFFVSFSYFLSLSLLIQLLRFLFLLLLHALPLFSTGFFHFTPAATIPSLRLTINSFIADIFFRF